MSTFLDQKIMLTYKTFEWKSHESTFEYTADSMN
jgi:hypothetical protein